MSQHEPSCKTLAKKKMKRTLSILGLLALLMFAGIAGYRLGLRHVTKWTEPYKAYIGGGSDKAIDADQIIVDLTDGKVVTVDLRPHGGKRLSIFAGLPWPDGERDPNWYSLNILPGGANAIHLGVEAHAKMSPEERAVSDKRGEELRKEIEEVKKGQHAP